MAGTQPLVSRLEVTPNHTEPEPKEALPPKALLFVCGCDTAIHCRAVCGLDGGGPRLLGEETQVVRLACLCQAAVRIKVRMRGTTYLFTYFQLLCDCLVTDSWLI